MSAYLVNTDTLDLLASAVTLYDRPDRGLYVYLDDTQAGPVVSDLHLTESGDMRYIHLREGHEDAIVRELWAANMASLEARYSDPSALVHDDLVSNVWRPILDVPIPEIMGALNCYEYQACEADTWRLSFARAICDSLRRKLCGMIAAGSWEYTRPEGYVAPVMLSSLFR